MSLSARADDEDVAVPEAVQPEITGHSQLSFAVNKGDSVTVEVQAKGEGLIYKWVKSDKTICREAICEFATSEWGLGTHRVTLVVYNGQASLFLKYDIRILTVPPGHVPSRVQAPLVESAQAVEAVRKDDLVVTALTGRGYSYQESKVQVVGPTPRALDWNEKLRSQASASLRFGREGLEEHVLGERSSVYLVKAESGRRGIVLRKGILRSRQLSGQAPRWSIIAEPWLQIDTDAQGDVLVERVLGENDEVTVTVLRGTARIFRETDVAGHQGKAITVAQGLEVHFLRGDAVTEPKLTEPDSKRMETLFAQTTPNYLPGKDPAASGAGWTIAGDRLPSSDATAMTLAREAMSHRDYMVALEMIAAREEELSDSFEGNMAVGEAAFGLGLFGPAVAALEQAAKIDPKAADPHFLIGYIALTGKQWSLARQHFEAAEDLDFIEAQTPQEAQELQYYLGVARVNAGDIITARNAFTYALWNDGTAEVATSARQFLEVTKARTWLDLRAGVGVFYDSNVLRSDDLDLSLVANDTLKTNKSAGYFGSGGFSVWGFRNSEAHAGFVFDIKRAAYVDGSLAALNTIDQKLALNFGFAMGAATATKPYLEVELNPSIRMIYVGEERAIDQLGTSLVATSPRFYGLGLTIDSVLNMDPIPGRDDILDPVLGEVVPAGERSSRDVIYGLRGTVIDRATWQLGIGVKSGATRMRSFAERGYNHAETTLGVQSLYQPSLRQSLAVDVSRLSRTFADSEDKREDTRLSMALAWTWHYTPALYQVFDMSYEAQSSSRDLSSYKRRWMDLRLGLDF